MLKLVNAGLNLIQGLVALAMESELVDDGTGVHAVIHEMDEKCQKAMEDWKNWENLTDERKAELLNERKAAYDKKKAAEEEMKAKQAKFEELMGKWDQLSLDEKKAAFDLCPCCKDKCRKGGEGKCCKGGEGKCQKEGGCSKGPKPEGCPDKH